MSKKPNKQQRSELGIFGFVLAAMGLAFVAAFMADSTGAVYGSALSLIWLYVTALTFTLGIIYFAQFVAPIRGHQGWLEGLRLILRAYAGQAQQFVRQRGAAAQKKRQLTSAVIPPMEMPHSLVTLRAGLLRSYQVAAITRAHRFVRPAGPGFVNLYYKEEIRQLIDLRVQLRQQPFHVNTRDGISIQTTVTVIFQVKQTPDAYPREMLFPYDREAIFHLSYLYTVDEAGTPVNWPEQIAARAAALLAQELAQFDLNALIHAPSTAVSPQEEMVQRVLTTLRNEFDPQGVNIITVKSGPLQLPQDIEKQHIANWRAEWDSKIQVEQATGQAEVIRRMKQARARAQVETIETIIHNLELMRREGESDLYQVIILRLIDALEEAVVADMPQTFPQQIMAGLLADTSAQMRARLEDSLLPPGELPQNEDEERP